MESLVMQAWRKYTNKLVEIDQRARRTPRMDGAVGIYLSEATGCPRKASLRLLKYPAAKRNQYSYQAMASGIKGEEKVALVLEACGWKVRRQEPLVTKYGNGRIDLLVDLDDTTSDLYHTPLMVIEIKTSTLDRLKWLPQKDHVEQCLLYMGVIHHQTAFPPPLGEVVYLLKQAHDATDDQQEKIATFPVAWDEQRFEYLIGQLDLIDTHVRQRTPVPLELAGDVRPDKPPCAYPRAGQCQFWQHCWGQTQVETSDEMVEI